MENDILYQIDMSQGTEEEKIGFISQLVKTSKNTTKRMNNSKQDEPLMDHVKPFRPALYALKAERSDVLERILPPVYSLPPLTKNVSQFTYADREVRYAEFFRDMDHVLSLVDNSILCNSDLQARIQKLDPSLKPTSSEEVIQKMNSVYKKYKELKKQVAKNVNSLQVPAPSCRVKSQVPTYTPITVSAGKGKKKNPTKK